MNFVIYLPHKYNENKLQYHAIKKNAELKTNYSVEKNINFLLC